MLFSQRYWSGLADGSVTVAFRRWKRPTVKAGGTLQTPGGLLAIVTRQAGASSDACAPASRTYSDPAG